MVVVLTTETWGNGDQVPTIQISDDGDGTLFALLAGVLATHLRGTWVTKLDGFDQRYWDLKTPTAMLTLHLEHYLGISLYVHTDHRTPASHQELLKAHEFLTLFQP